MNTPDQKLKVLFLCTGNSARSILAEYFLKRLDPARFEAYSAGAQPKGSVHPYALEILREGYHIDAAGARSKSWDEYRGVPFDFVITVCDNARESCPVWPGQPIVAHWGSETRTRRKGPRTRSVESSSGSRRRSTAASASSQPSPWRPSAACASRR